MQLTLCLMALLGAQPTLDTLLIDLPGMTSPPTEAVSTDVDGMRVTQRSCTSKRSVAELRAHFTKLFVKAGLFLPPEQDKWQPEQGEQVTGLDSDNLLTFTALLQPAGKSTTVVLAMANVGARKTVPAGDLGLPIYPGASAPTVFDVEATRAISYAVPATPAQIKTFYRKELAAAGYVEQEGLVFVKGRQQLTVVVSPGVTERYVMVKVEPLGAGGK